MKKAFLSLIFSLFACCVFAQTPITLTFIGRDSISQDLIALDSVYVKNITEDCDTTLYGEAPVLSIIAQWPVSVEQPTPSQHPSFVLHQNFPNPFSGSTTVQIYREYGGQLQLMLMNGLGVTLAEYSGELEAGLHAFSVSTGGHSVLFLVARDSRSSHSLKLVSSGTVPAAHTIRNLGYIPEGDETANLKGTSSDGFLYILGNQLSYTAYATGFREKIILDSPVADNTYYFDMAQLLPPTVTTDAVTEITQSTATCGGNVTGDGGAEVTVRGVCWSTSPNPTTAGSYTLNGGGLGTFVSYLINLSANTLYYVRAYATNSIGTAYGNEVSFTTGQSITPPVVTTASVTNITATTATSGGTVTSDGGAAVTARGVCWSTTANPTTAGNHTTDGTGTGTFVSSLTGLTGSTLYYVRAYATNSMGTSYGNEVTFTTLSLPTLTTATVTNIAETTATSGGTVTSDGGAAVTARGVCWSTTANPTTAGSHTTDGTGTGTFVSSLTGLTGSTLYYVRAYATNSVGTSYGNELTFTTLNLPTVTTATVTNITATTATSGGTVTSDGGASVTARGVCWSTTANPTTAGSHTTDGTGTGTFTSSLTGLTAGTLYYVRAYATNSVGTSYGNELTFTTLNLPTVTTATVTDITATTATSGGTVTSDGGASVTARGVCWSTTANPTTAGSHTTDGTGTGTFVSSLTGLTGSTLYYVRAYATNSVGTSYGNELTFTTMSSFTCGGNVDYEGKSYSTVLIGTQCWFKENLNVGTKIPGTQNQANNGVKEKYCYNDLESNCDTYGGLYQWDELMQYLTTQGAQGLCPQGWHIPTDGEWTTLTTYLGGESIAGGKMKEAGTLHWLAPNTGATNSSGFTALPGGLLDLSGISHDLTLRANFWSSTTSPSISFAWCRELHYWSEVAFRWDGNHKLAGQSCRCLQD